MTSDRIKEIQETTAYPESVSVKQALLQVWNECEQERNALINSEIERRITEAEKGIEARIKQGLYTNMIDYPEALFKLGVSWLKLNLIK